MRLGARTGAWAKSGGGIPTAADYVQDGLIAMWDGIENAGWGTHDASATTWVDLKGNCNLNMVVGTPIWNAKYCQFDGYSSFEGNTNSNFQSAFGANHDFTIEIVNTVNQIVVGNVCGVGSNEDIGSNPWLKYGYDDSRTGIGFGVGNKFNNIPIGVDVNDLCRAVAYRNGGYFYEKRIDGSEMSYGSLTAAIASTNFTIGTDKVFYNGSFIKKFMPCSVYCARIYNRVLSASELSENYTVDQARFEIA